MREIANRDLSLDDVPPFNADWDQIGEFALSFNGYIECGSFERCAEVANNRRNDTLTELRACLFFEQRRWRHFGYEPDAEAMAYIRGLLEKVRDKVTTGHFE